MSWCAGAFGSRRDFGMTLFYTTPLIFTGLSVAIAFHAGLFNIGAEGQLDTGRAGRGGGRRGLAGIALAAGTGLATLAALAAGTIWGAIPGWLRARRGSHEVINTIMLNFIAAGLASYVTLYLLKNPDSQNPETRPDWRGISDSSIWYFWRRAGEHGVAVWRLPLRRCVWILLWRTVLGFEMRAVGQSEPAARAAGIDSGGSGSLRMSVAGGLAGLVGVGEVLGNAGNFRLGFSPEYGFLGIAVALLGRNQPLGVVAAALLFGALHKGAADLDMETEHVTRELSLVLQALIILSVIGGWALELDEKTGRNMIGQLAGFDAAGFHAADLCGARRHVQRAVRRDQYRARRHDVDRGVWRGGGNIGQPIRRGWGSACGMGAGVALAAIYGLFVIRLRANQIVAGMAINMLAMGLTPFFCKILYDVTGSTPAIPIGERFQSAPLYLCWGLVVVCWSLDEIHAGGACG